LASALFFTAAAETFLPEGRFVGFADREAMLL